jgi:hypothetical protein
MATNPILDREQGPGFRRKRTQVVGLYTDPPPGAVVVCADELGPVTPRTFPPGPAWSAGGHRIKAPLEYFRGPDKTWVYGALRVADGTAVTMTAASRNSVCYQRFLQRLEDANPGEGDIWVIADNLSSHDSLATRTWLAEHPRIRHAFIPVGACWLNLQEAWCGSSVITRWPECPSLMAGTSTTPPASLPPSSTSGPDPGSGDGHHQLPGAYAVSSPTAFEERSTRRATAIRPR